MADALSEHARDATPASPAPRTSALHRPAAASADGERLHAAAVESYTRAVATGYQTAAAVVLLLSVVVLVRRGGSGRKDGTGRKPR